MAKRIRKKPVLISSQKLDDSPSRKQSIGTLVTNMWEPFEASIAQAQEMERWYRNELAEDEMPDLPNKVRADITPLRESTPTSWAKMIADGTSQDLIIDGMMQEDTGKDAAAWRLFKQNRLTARQKPVHDGAIRHGKSFNLVGPAVGRLDGEPTAFIRGKSALNCDAFFRDDFDEFPEYFIERTEARDGDKRVWLVDLYDESKHHRLQVDFDGRNPRYLDWEEHGLPLCPAVRAAGNIDLTGRATGEIEPYIKVFKRINQSTMDRLVVQRYGAFVIRWLAGIDKPKDKAASDAAALALSLTDLIMIPGDGKAGSLPGTPLDGYIRSREADIRDLSAVSQTPSFHMLGLSDNVGADGLAAAEASHMRKIALWKIMLGDFWETSMRLAGAAMGDEEIARDFTSLCHWKDTSAQSFQSLAQGLSTLVTGLGIPGKTLWNRVLDQSEIERALQEEKVEQAKAEREALAAQSRQLELQESINQGATRGNVG